MRSVKDWTTSGKVLLKRLDPLTVVFLALAGAWAMGQFVLAFFVHVTERAKLTGAGWVVPPTKTYIQSYALSEVVLTAVVLGILNRPGIPGDSIPWKRGWSHGQEGDIEAVSA